MNTKHSAMNFAVIVLVLANTTAALAQGTVTFNNPWINEGVAYFGLGYFDGMSFRVSNPEQPGAGMAQIGATLDGHPSNGTPHLEPTSSIAPGFVIFAWTDAASQGHTFLNGAPFGLVSVDLADPVAPSLSPIFITFNGFRADNSIVSQTFTVGGGGSTIFQTFLFNSDFASDLVRVEIPSPLWAMDNIVYVPEPGTWALFLVGLLALTARWARGRVISRRHP